MISVIEDNYALRKGLVDILETKGFSAKGFNDGQDFLDETSQTHFPELIISDVQMSSVSGLELLKKLRSTGIKTPVILMSASIDESLPAKCIECGAAAFFSKPFELQQLINQIDNILSSIIAINR